MGFNSAFKVLIKSQAEFSNTLDFGFEGLVSYYLHKLLTQYVQS